MIFLKKVVAKFHNRNEQLETRSNSNQRWEKCVISCTYVGYAQLRQKQWQDIADFRDPVGKFLGGCSCFLLEDFKLAQHKVITYSQANAPRVISRKPNNLTESKSHFFESKGSRTFDDADVSCKSPQHSRSLRTGQPVESKSHFAMSSSTKVMAVASTSYVREGETGDHTLTNNESKIINLMSDESDSEVDHDNGQSSDLAIHKKSNPVFSHLNCCIIDELVQNGFNNNNSISDEYKCEVIHHKMPFPKESEIWTISSGDFKINLCQEDFVRHSWLAGCPTLQKLICWSCSLVYWKLILIEPVWILDNASYRHDLEQAHIFSQKVLDNWKAKLALKITPDFFNVQWTTPEKLHAGFHLYLKKRQQMQLKQKVLLLKQNKSVTHIEQSENTLGQTSDPIPRVGDKKSEVGNESEIQLEFEDCRTTSDLPKPVREPLQLPPLPNVLYLLEEPSDHDYVQYSSQPQCSRLSVPNAVHSKVHTFCSMSLSHSDLYKNKGGDVCQIYLAGSRVKEGESLSRHEDTSDLNNETTPMGDSILAELLLNNFLKGTWTHEEQVRIVRNGRPRPEFEPAHSKYTLPKTIYQEWPWLTVSEDKQQFFCWPCLLFGEVWSWGGGKTHSFTSKIIGHGRSNKHRHTCLVYNTWILNNFKTKSNPNNEGTTASRHVLKCMIDVACVIRMNTSHSSLSTDGIYNLIQVLSNTDRQLKRDLNKMSITSSNVHSVLEDYSIRITDAIVSSLQNRIIDELRNTNFVCLILSRLNEWVSVIARFVTKEGKIVERFVRALKVDLSQNHERFISNVMNILAQLGCTNKLVGITMDGPVLKASELKLCNDMMRTSFETAQVCYYRFRDLRTELMERLSELTYIKIFYHNINRLGKFIEPSKELFALMVKVDSDLNKNSKPWDLSAGLIVTVNNHYPAFVLFLEKILSSAELWPYGTVVHAWNFRKFLRSFDNRFLIATLSRIHSAIASLSETLAAGFDTTELDNEASIAFRSVYMARREFLSMYNYAKNVLVPPSMLVEPEHGLGPSLGNYRDYNYMYVQILDLAMDFLDTRAQNTKEWRMSELDVYRWEFKSAKSWGSTRWRLRLRNFFTLPLLIAQSATMKYAFFDSIREDPLKTLQVLHKLDLIELMPDYCKLLHLILTVPLATTETTAHARAVERIAAYASTNPNLGSNGAMIWINSDLLSAMKKEKNFYENIVELLKSTEEPTRS